MAFWSSGGGSLPESSRLQPLSLASTKLKRILLRELASWQQREGSYRKGGRCGSKDSSKRPTGSWPTVWVEQHRSQLVEGVEPRQVESTQFNHQD